MGGGAVVGIVALNYHRIVSGFVRYAGAGADCWSVMAMILVALGAVSRPCHRTRHNLAMARRGKMSDQAASIKRLSLPAMMPEAATLNEHTTANDPTSHMPSEVHSK
jgi:nitrate reductase gamma subunit